MIWGNLWDETLEWLCESGGTLSDGTPIERSLIASNSKTWGNYIDATFNYIAEGSNFPQQTEKKQSGSSNYKLIPTGSSEYTKVNNIYDLAGNVWEWTLEANSTGSRVYRGGDYGYDGDDSPASNRGIYGLGFSSDSVGSRSVLLIK